MLYLFFFCLFARKIIYDLCMYIVFAYWSAEHIGRLVRMSVLHTEVDGSNPGSSMLFP